MKSLKSLTELPNGRVLLKFEAFWCGLCKKYTPTIEKLEEEFGDITFLSVDIDDVPEAIEKYTIKSIPLLILLNDGVEIDRVEGFSLITPLRAILNNK